MKIMDSRECTFCRGETETLTHLFWHCPKVQQFVNELITYMKQKYNKVINIDIISWFFPTEHMYKCNQLHFFSHRNTIRID